MSDRTDDLGPPEAEAATWRLFRDHFDLAERRRRWSLRDDVPWGQCNRGLPPEIADVVESFFAVEIFLPDYVSRILPLVRESRARAWFYANWGYEEAKHSLALQDWLERSGQRSASQIAGLEASALQRQWQLPHDSRLGMLVYAMTQERATWLSYRNLRLRADERGGCPALDALLGLLATDERVHYEFFMRCVGISLHYQREATLEQMRRVMNDFAMPAIHDLADGRERVARIKDANVLDERLYFAEVYAPILEALGVTRQEMRNPSRTKPRTG